jgi:hypothetical protein
MRTTAVRSASAVAALLVAVVIAPASPPVGAQATGLVPFVIDDTTPAAGQIITVSGEGCTGTHITLRVRQRAKGFIDIHSIDWDVPLAPDGSWTGHGMVRDDAQPGTVIGVTAYCEKVGGYRPYPVAAITVSAASADPTQVFDAVAEEPFRVGQSLTVAGTGCEPGSRAYVSINKLAYPYQADGLVDADGSWEVTGTIKRGDGRYWMSATCGAPGLGAEDVRLSYLRRMVVVRPAQATTTTTTTTSTSPPVATTAVPPDTAPPATPQPASTGYTG